MEIPKQVQSIIDSLEKAKFEVFVVGGCVRDMLSNREPKDWDITTNAKPEEIEKTLQKQGIKTFYENSFGTVTAVFDEQNIEITPYRKESKYSDKRHPDEVKWAKKLKDDLSRRDFTVNALAFGEEKLVDHFKGEKDLKNKIIRAVGNPQERFSEDALRMMRAVRFSVTLGFDIEEKTRQGIIENADLLGLISKERVKDELIKIVMHIDGAKGIEILRRLGLLKHIIPELEQGFKVNQNKHHVFQVYEHNLLSLNYACENNFSLYVRMASLLHDVGKPKTKKGQGEQATFYNHEIVGAHMADKILRRLKFPKKDLDKIVKLVRLHLFYYNVDEVGESSVRRLLRKIGQQDLEELMQVRYCDRIGSGVPKAEPYKLRHLKYLFEKVSKDPISAKMLALKGDEIMKILKIKPGPKVGHILTYLLSLVLSDPKNNNKEFLTEKAKEVGKLGEKELEKLAKNAKQDVDNVIIKKDKMTKQKYWVS